MMRAVFFSAMLTLGLCLNAQTKIEVEVDKPLFPVSKNLYGIFFEDINHAGDGGLYAELINNRSFEANRLPEDMYRVGDYIFSKQGFKMYYPQPRELEGWEIETSGNASGKAMQDDANPLNPFNLKSMRVEVSNPDRGGYRIINRGYWGISVVKGEKYKLSIYLRASSSASMQVALRDVKGNWIDSKIINGIPKTWKKYEVTFTAKTTDPQAVFVLAPLTATTYWVDMVSLFPENTFKKRPNGLRADIAQMIADFKPGFLRFPGGCVVEGADYENRIIWKNTIGDISRRLGRWELWGYHNTDGLGFHEFLQFCEDLGCPGMYVINVGMSCQFRRCEVVDSARLQEQINEVLDALEYALGPTTSRWGAERARNGHPQPFNLKYVEIGNENYGPVYQERYNIFYKAIKEKYPQIITIACTDPAMRDPFKAEDLIGIHQPIEVIDEHFYEGLDFFYQGAFRYDSYDRKGPKVYVGEYAVKKWDNTLKGNLEAALAEAAFMTGFERNADIVILSSQAPTLVNANDRTWNPDLIVFNSSQVYGTPSYYGQRMFSTNIPDYAIPVKVENSGHELLEAKSGVGILSFANPQACCRYTDITIQIGGKNYPLEQIIFPTALSKIKQGTVTVGKTDFVDLKFKDDIYQKCSAADWDNYTISLRAIADSIDDLEVFSILFYSTGIDQHYKWVLGRWHRRHFLQWYDRGYEGYFAQAPGNIEAGKWYDIRITVKNKRVYAYLNNELVYAVDVPKRVKPGIYAAAGINADKTVILKVVNATDEAKDIPIVLKGAQLPYGQMSVETLTGNPQDENTFEQPTRIVPQKTIVNIPGSEFNYMFPAHSINVLRITRP
ncbi:MAG: alpha-L-arabinofuranosidase C-terminal domain-containing protein [Bacteroidales bacterium]